MIQAEIFTGKLNKIDGNIYTVEEQVNLVDGSYEGELLHDNINEATLAVFTGPKLTGDRLQTYSISTPSLTPWKRSIRIFADVDTVYISYETDGDTVEAEDINRVQEAVVKAQEAVNAEEARAQKEEQNLEDSIQDECQRAIQEETRLDGIINTEARRAQEAEKRLNDDLLAEAQRAAASEKVNADNTAAETIRAEAAEEAIRNTIHANQPNWDDKYTRNEVDNKFSALETAIDWKEAVDTYADLTASYPQPDDGWTVNVKDTDYTYRWSGSAWIAISANAIPKATQSVDGLLTKEDKISYDDASVKRHTHGNKSTLDKLTESLLANWSDAYNKRHEHGNQSVMDKITQTFLDNWNAAYTHVSNKSNPHAVTKSQIGLGSVPNAATNDQTPTYTQAEVLENVVSGEKLSLSFGKIMKAIAEFIVHKADAAVHITSSERTKWNAVTNKVDKVTGKQLSANDYTTAEKNKLAGIAEGADKYVHPTTSGNRHIPAGGSSGQILRWSADGSASWGTESNNDTKMTQINSTDSADYRLLLSAGTNDSTETGTGRKSGNFLANPATGEFYAKGYRRTDITGQSLDIDTLTISTGAPAIMRYIVKTGGGAAGISNIPVAGHPFILDAELMRWASAADYVTMQTFRSVNNPANEYVRYCTSGTWSSWTVRVFTDTKYIHPESGAAAGTYRSVTVNNQGHVTAGTNPTTLSGYGITDAAAKVHNHDSSYLKKGVIMWNDLKGGI